MGHTQAAQNATKVKANSQQQIRAYFTGRINNNFRGFGRVRIPHYTHDGRGLGQENQKLNWKSLQEL